MSHDMIIVFIMVIKDFISLVINIVGSAYNPSLERKNKVAKLPN